MAQENETSTTDFKQETLEDVTRELAEQNARSSRWLKINAGDLVSINLTGNVFSHIADFGGTKKKMWDFELTDEIDSPSGKIHKLLSFSDGQFTVIKSLVDSVKAGRKSMKIGRSGTGKDTRYTTFVEK